MGLRSDIQEALVEAWGGDLIDVVSNFNLVRNTLGTYNKTLGIRPKTEVLYGSKAAFLGFDSKEIDGINIKSKDVKVILNEFDISIEPKIDDVIRFDNGEELIIVSVTNIPEGVQPTIVFILQARQNVGEIS